MTGEIAHRDVKVETSGRLEVKKSVVRLSNLRDFLMLAEAHGIDNDAILMVNVNREYNHDTGSHDLTTVLSVDLPVVPAFGPGPRPVSPRRKRAQRTAKNAGIAVGATAIGIPVLLFVVGLLVRLFDLALGFVF